MEEMAEYIAAGPRDPIRIGTGLFYSDVDDVMCWRDYVKMIAHPEFHPPPPPAKRATLRSVSVLDFQPCHANPSKFLIMVWIL
jgi:hypothetical protein